MSWMMLRPEQMPAWTWFMAMAMLGPLVRPRYYFAPAVCPLMMLSGLCQVDIHTLISRNACPLPTGLLCWICSIDSKLSKGFCSMIRA